MKLSEVKKNKISRLKLSLIIMASSLAASCTVIQKEEGFAFGEKAKIKSASVECRILDENQALRYVIDWNWKVYNSEGKKVGRFAKETHEVIYNLQNHSGGLLWADGSKVIFSKKEMKKVAASDLQYFHMCRRKGELF